MHLVTRDDVGLLTTLVLPDLVGVYTRLVVMDGLIVPQCKYMDS